MIKRTLYFGNPAYLSFKNQQLIIEHRYLDSHAININDDYIEIDTGYELSEIKDKYLRRKYANEAVPVEDIAVVILDHHGVSTSQYLISKLLENNVAVIFCNDNHHPTGLLLNLDGNHLQSEKFRSHINATLPLKKQLWMQTVCAKILNQRALLNLKGVHARNLLSFAKRVNSGDTKNYEARASVYYWRNLFPYELNFYRDRFGEPPNNLLNYGYAILRAIVARGLVSSGLLPTLGIHHRNKYNAYCLADDIMEPYRPFVDKIVSDIIDGNEDYTILSTGLKKQLLKIPVTDICIEGKRSPLMIGIQKTTSSLAKCFEGKRKKIIYPEFV